MFTGLVFCLGEVVSRSGSEREARFTIMPRKAFAAPERGESIAVNGACLTAERFDGEAFVAYASGETLSRTTLASLRPGSLVNLERAVALGTRLGGHMVSGHVDCVAAVAGVAKKGDSTVFRLDFPRAMAHLVVPKGSVALDGVSLTVNDCGLDYLSCNIIPETLNATTICGWKSGTLVNLETDLVGKYVARMVETGYALPGNPAAAPSGLTMDFLRENGF